MSEWQPIDAHYDVSDCGSVRRSDGSPVGQWINDQGYAIVRLSKPRRQVRVHRLVAKAFIPNPRNKPFVNHINNDRSDNRASNLEWCTQWENLAHARIQGRTQRDYWKGKRSPNARLSDTEAESIREEYAKGGVSWATLGQKYGVSKRTVGRIVGGESYVR